VWLQWQPGLPFPSRASESGQVHRYNRAVQPSSNPCKPSHKVEFGAKVASQRMAASNMGLEKPDTSLLLAPLLMGCR
jgi:hypothetical protein